MVPILHRTAYLRLPLTYEMASVAERRARAPAERQAPERAMSQVLIAIVDDDEPVRDATKTLVRSLGYNNVSTFGSADEFLKCEQVHDTSCLITDVQMPGLSGLDLQDHLVVRGHCIPIIFMTGHPDDNVRARAMKAGAVCFLHKPLSPDHFIGCIEKALRAA
jgi:FixJ family two-component response regulator